MRVCVGFVDELWTVDQAARHWGVTPARARGILSTRRIRRVAGYPASAIRAVHRRQGARVDLAAAANALTLSDAAEAINAASGDPSRLRVFSSSAAAPTKPVSRPCASPPPNRQPLAIHATMLF
jgi:hypothetical protein